jgi:hypothetical protein
LPIRDNSDKTPLFGGDTFRLIVDCLKAEFERVLRCPQCSGGLYT